MSTAERYHYDENADQLTIERIQDCTPILEQVERDRLTAKEVPGLGYLVGRIPGEVVQNYMQEVGITYHEFMVDNSHIHKIMNDPDFKKFRVWEGRV